MVYLLIITVYAKNLFIIVDAVRKRFEISDKMFESIIGNWFRQAKLRYMRNLEKERKRELD